MKLILKPSCLSFPGLSGAERASTDALLARRQHPAHTAYRIRYTSPRMRMKVLYGEDAGPSDEELEARAMRRGAARRGRRSGSRFGLVGATEGTSERSGMRDRTACRRRRTNPSRTLPGGRRKGGHLYWGGRGRAGAGQGQAGSGGVMQRERHGRRVRCRLARASPGRPERGRCRRVGRHRDAERWDAERDVRA